MPESVPNYLTTDAAGNVGAVFAGGVNLPLVPGGAPPWQGAPAGNSVTWTRQADGAMVAQAAASESSTDDILTLTARDSDPNTPSYTNLNLDVFRGGSGAEASVEAWRGTAPSTWDGWRKVLLDSAGHSDYMLRSTGFAVWSGVGPWSTLAQPNPTAGARLDTGQNGYYIFIAGCTCFATTAGDINVSHYLDGNLLGGLSFFFNQANVHLFTGVFVGVVNLANAGAQYHWLRVTNGTTGVVSSNSGDNGFSLLIPN